jgi:gliding motility-associated-like protein
MKKLVLAAVSLLFAASSLFAQVPANDECATAINLGTAPACDTSIVYGNDNATLSNIGDDNNPSCFNGGIPNRDVWFSFVCPDTLFDFRVSLFGTGGPNGIVNPQIAIYRGDCTFNDLFELSCAIAPLLGDEVFIDLEGLTPGVTYYIRVSDYSPTASPNSGNFTLCVDKKPEVNTIDEGGSTQCSGVLTDSGGPDGDYGPNENHIFTICPPQPVSCITFTLDYFNIEEGFDDELAFYNGNSTSAPPITSVATFNTNAQYPTNGGVALTVQGTGPCMTIQFSSDGSEEFEGFLGHWECSSSPCPVEESITVESPIDPQIIVDAVTSPATQVTITNIDCADESIGSFSYPTANNDLQMTKGIILSSGFVNEIPDLGFGFASGIMNTPGDADLDFLSEQQGGQESNDACVVEMDVFVATDQLEFEYVFGSEEYPEFVFSSGGFNDIFAFLVSGPGILGDPGLNGQKNIAVLPSSNIPVEINSVNNQINWQYYRNNEEGEQLVFDGLTADFLGVKKSLTAKTSVTPCNTYHLKLAVADRGDSSYDSGVFISEIKGGTPNLEVVFASGIDYFVENCSGTEDYLIISLANPLPQATTFITSIGGTATLGVDYVLNLPATITFPAGVTELTFPIFPLNDALVEGTETIKISLSSNFGCGSILQKEITINLEDNVVVSVNGGQDEVFVCSGIPFQLNATGAQDYFWSPPSAVSSPIIANPTITATQDVVLIVTGTLAACVDKDTILVKVVSPTIDAVATGLNNICVGGSVNLSAINNVANQGLIWTPATGLNDATAQNPVASPTVSTTYTATLDLGACQVSDQITVNVDTLFAPQVIADTVLCQNYWVTLADSIPPSTSNYQWTPVGSMDDPNSPAPLAAPQQTTTYTLITTSDNGYCSSSQSVTVTVVPADLEIQGPKSYKICLGTTIPLEALAIPTGGSVVQWSPPFYVSNTTGPSTVVNTDESLTVYAKFSVNGCNLTDSVRITVDSLPDLSLSLRPAKNIYCPGDTVTLLSPTYEPASFPFIKNTWLPDGLGQVTPDSLWNLVIRAQVTDTFTRITVNRGCADTVSIVVPVDSIPVLTVTASKDKVCPGEASQLNAFVEPSQALKWSPAEGLTCTDCLNPIAVPNGTTTYSVTTPDANCPAGSGITIQVLPKPIIGVLPDISICLGASTPLNNAPAELATTYTWTSNPPGFTSSDAQPQATPTVPTSYLLVANNVACTASDSIRVTPVTATVNAGPDATACEGVVVNLNAVVTGSTGGTFNWQAGGVSLSSLQSFGYSAGQTELITLTYSYGTGGACNTTDQLTVTINERPVLLEVVPSKDDLCGGEPFAVNSNVVGGTPVYSYNWTLDGTAYATTSQDSIQLSLDSDDDQPRGYTIGLSVTDANNCLSDPKTVSVTVKECFAIPNAFTPGNGGVNDIFKPEISGGNVNITNFAIYNRWGQKVFTASPTKEGWDGTFGGKPAPVDVYIYQISIQRLDGSKKDYSGGKSRCSPIF